MFDNLHKLLIDALLSHSSQNFEFVTDNVHSILYYEKYFLYLSESGMKLEPAIIKIIGRQVEVTITCAATNNSRILAVGVGEEM